MNTTFFCVCLLVLKLNLTLSDVVIEIHFTRFQNDEGYDAFGKKCDNWPFVKCDPKFVFCLETDVSTGNCDVWRQVTDHYSNENSIDFGSDMQGIDNPIVTRRENWPRHLTLRVTITDYDWIFYDKLDAHVITLSVDQPFTDGYYQWYQESVTGTRADHPTKLDFRYTVYCTQNYYGPSCNVYCVPHDDHHGHYTCEAPSGDKVCRPGWQDPSTDCVSRDVCHEHPCLNGGTCVDDDDAVPVCHCTDGYVGRHCENRDMCADEICHNGGTCVSGRDQVFRCICPPQHYGTLCEGTTVCPPDSCKNGGRCVDVGLPFNFTCQCPPGYYGSQCEVKDPCVSDPCAHGATCWASSEGRLQCFCRPAFTGQLCEDEIDLCTPDVCTPPLTCYQDDGNYWCLSNGKYEEVKSPTDIPQVLWIIPIAGIILVGALITACMVYRKRKLQQRVSHVSHLENCTSEKASNVYEEIPFPKGDVTKGIYPEGNCPTTVGEMAGKQTAPLESTENMHAIVNISYKHEEI